MPDCCAILDLRDAPGFAEIVAYRVWRAWWKDEGVPFAALKARLSESLGPSEAAIPTSFIACRGAEFLGTVALIASDVEERPGLTPWVAALWVEEPARAQGIGQALLTHASDVAFAAGHAGLYLCATAANAPYYARRGWKRIERDVDGVDIFMRERDDA
ncbi:GNAT family N-acetyltransferase [Ancylobacter sp. WKF20]|uniref:GNAT family N-acetyltransferase n=1 Tax=Ancylobacter sp. WKF20 TaxID=3039801 RepID=UPI0024341867|nr:GNAT family N-acetyltransferase [Ancylobacter sp. WKF20]WGD29461.1 GNAT family N-acetyltransferase [Ancylobacter sp. WKF20]